MNVISPERFKLIRKLGEGGMGIVYEAYDSSRDISIALKLLRARDPEDLYRFKREFRALRDVNHPNIIRLHELGFDGRDWFLAMELILGEDFLSYVRRDFVQEARVGPKPGNSRRSDTVTSTLTTVAVRATAANPTASSDSDLRGPTDHPVMLGDAVSEVHERRRFDELVNAERLWNVLPQLIRALHSLHSANIVHRDLKPSNVMVDRDGRVVLMDFGILAELCQQRDGDVMGGVIGTPPYMAPEQHEGNAVASAADWYAFGVLLYQTLTGRLPFRGTYHEIVRAKRDGKPVAPSALVSGIPEHLEELCLRLMACEPSQRPGYAQLMYRLSIAAPNIHLNDQESAPSVGFGHEAVKEVFVGRRMQREALAEAYAQVCAGRTQCVFVIGPSGIGKTCLNDHFLQDLEAGRLAGDRPILLSGRCHERENLPYKAFDGVIDDLTLYLVQALKVHGQSLLGEDLPSVLPRLFAVLRRVPSLRVTVAHEGRDPMELRRQAAIELRALLKTVAHNRPMVMRIEDIQWADQDSIDLLDELLRPPAPDKLLLLMSIRSEALASGEVRWRDTISALEARGLGRRVGLGPLSADETDEFVRAMTAERGWRQALDVAIWTQARGHPLILAELVRFACDPGPQPLPGNLQLEDILSRRVARLPIEARRLIEIIAIAGRPAPLRVLAKAASMDGSLGERAAALLQISHLIRVAGAVEWEPLLDVYHAKLREAITNRMPPEKAVLLHRRLAHCFEDWDGAAAATKARHWLAAGDRGMAATYLVAAARDASAQLALESAAEYYRKALELLPDESSDDAVEILRCQAWIGVAEGLRNTHRDDQAMSLLDRAQTIAAAKELIDELSNIHYLRGSLLYRQSDARRCRSEHERSLEYARRYGSVQREASALSGLGDACFLSGHLSVAESYLEHCVALCREEHYTWLEAASMSMRGTIRYYRNDLAAALSDGTLAVETARVVGHSRAEAIARFCCLGWPLIELERFDEARQEYEKLLEASSMANYSFIRSGALTSLGKIYFHQGARDAAKAFVEEGLAMSHEVDHALWGPAHFAAMALVTEDRSVYREAIGRAEELLRVGYPRHTHLHFYRDALDAGLQFEDLDTVERLARALEAYTWTEPMPWSRFFIGRARALSAHIRGHRDEQTVVTLRQLAEEARACELHLARRALDCALA